ncbi:Uncharacterized protein SCF082_LOCUS28933 [Durusdinium trenchii]|uniref:Uncharacterized protein n=1 Tax=Durusdinium trenchii TaxID=1381693 RepID=A0ABP0MQG9_9DINO
MEDTKRERERNIDIYSILACWFLDTRTWKLLRYLNYSRNHAVLVRPTSPQDGQLLFKFEWDKVKLSLRVTSAMSGEFVCTVPGRWGPRATFWKALDAFVGLCDRMQEEADRMRLGCCQVLCIVNKKHLDPELRKQTLEHIFGHAALELEQIAEGAIGTTYITDEDITDEAEEPSSEEACQRTEAERQRSLAWRKETAKASKSIANLNSCYVSLKGVMDKSAKNANVLSVEMKKDLQEAEGKIRTLKLSATAIIGTDEAARAQSDPPALGEASAIQDTVKAAQMLLKDARKVFAEKAAEAKALKEPKPKKASKPKAVSVRGASERAAAEIWNIIQSDEKQISRGRAERLVAAELKPWIDAMQDEPFLRHDGSTVALPVVDLKPCLQHLCQKSVLTEENETGFALSGGAVFKQRAQAFFIGDLEAVRSIYSFKGSAGMRPCVLCLNCVKSGYVASSDSYFKEVSASSGFLPSSDDDIFQMCERLRAAVSKADLEAQEKCSGLSYNPASLLWSPATRVKMAPSRIIGDAMHLYFVNGICSWEIALFLQIVFDHTPLTLSALQDVVLAGNWVSAKSTGRTRTYLKNLFHERLYGDGLFKGQRHQTTALLPLLFYFTLTAIEPSGLVPAR